jgi:DNA-binding transcriptional MerR regulator
MEEKLHRRWVKIGGKKGSIFNGKLHRNGTFKIKGNNDYAFVTHHSGEKIDTNTFTSIFLSLAQKLGYRNNNGKGFQILCKSHALRKFFSNTLEDAGMPRKKIEFMMAHFLTDNELAYYENEIKKLKELYISFLPHITFEKEIKVVSLSTEDEKRLHELEKRDSERGAKVKVMEGQIKELSETLDTVTYLDAKEMFGFKIDESLPIEEKLKIYEKLIKKQVEEFERKNPSPPSPSPSRDLKLTEEDYKLLIKPQKKKN